MSPLPPGPVPDGALASVPGLLLPDATAPGGSTVGGAPADGAPGVAPWERRQPQLRRRSVVPVEWFRRLPGGGTTYAPGDEPTTPAGSPDDTDGG